MASETATSCMRQKTNKLPEQHTLRIQMKSHSMNTPIMTMLLNTKMTNMTPMTVLT